MTIAVDLEHKAKKKKKKKSEPMLVVDDISRLVCPFVVSMQKSSFLSS